MQIQIFKHNNDKERLFDEVRTIELEGELWFVASDITRNLGYSNGRDAITRHCKSKGVVKRDIPTPSGLQSATLIKESNVYRLIIRSKLPAASIFEDWVLEEVVPEIRKTGSYGKIDRVELPNFIERYKDNMHKIPRTHFSVISEMFVRMYIELEKVGYSIPDIGSTGKKMMPDISVGRKFSDYLKSKKSTHLNNRDKYEHSFPDGRIVNAFMYPMDALPEFIAFIHEEWIPKYAQNYFKRADPNALVYIDKLMLQAPKG